MDKSFIIHHQNIQTLVIDIYKIFHGLSTSNCKELFVFRNNNYTVLLRINAGGVHLIFDIFWGAFIQGRRLHEGGVYYKIQKKLQIYVLTSMISTSSSI